MKALDESILMVLFVLVLKIVNFLTIFALTKEGHDSRLGKSDGEGGGSERTSSRLKIRLNVSMIIQK